MDYTARLYQPWVFLKSGPRAGDLTLYLDLVTPLLPVIMWKSFKIHAWIPMVTSVCSLLLGSVVSSHSMLAQFCSKYGLTCVSSLESPLNWALDYRIHTFYREWPLSD